MRYSIYFILLAFIVSFSSCNKKTYIKNSGPVFGTFYNFSYETNGEDYEQEILDLLSEFNSSLSTYDPNSIISRINKDEEHVKLDSFFIHCYTKSQEISHKTDGAFDLTIAPVVNAWGFGFKNYDKVDSMLIDSLMQFVGYEKTKIENNLLVKEKAGIKLDASAIAKGYGVDVVANFLTSQGVDNFLVEIGGEINAKGINAKGNYWRVGIDKPIESVNASNRELQAIVALKNKSLATSGNYRQFYEKDGVKYSHTIDPKTGFPARNKLLSVSVLANNCLSADAYATAFMVMGLDKTKALIEDIEDLDVFLIYSDTTSQLKTFRTDNFYIVE